MNEALASHITATIVTTPPPLAAVAPAAALVTPPDIIAAQPQIDQAENQTEIQPLPNRKKWLKIGAASFVVLALLLAIGWFVLPFITPERALVAALSSLVQSDVTKYELTAEIRITPSTAQEEEIPYLNSKLNIEAAVDKTSPGKGRVLVDATKLDSNNQSSTNDHDTLELRWLENGLYIRLNAITEEIAMFGLGEFIGKWFYIDIQKTLKDLESNDQYNLELTPDVTEKLTDAYAKNPFLEVVASLGTQTIADQKSKGYQISYNKEKLANWLAESERITAQPYPLGKEEIMASIADPSEVGTIKIWVSKKTGLPIQSEYEQKATAEKPGMVSKVTLLSIGQPINVEKPSPVTPLDEMIKQLQSDFSDPTEQAKVPRKWLFSAYGSKDN